MEQRFTEENSKLWEANKQLLQKVESLESVLAQREAGKRGLTFFLDRKHLSQLLKIDYNTFLAMAANIFPSNQILRF